MDDGRDVTAILDRIAAGDATERDLKVLRRVTAKGDGNTVLVGDNPVNIGQGRDIHIGDRVYGGHDAELIRDVLRQVVRGVPRWAIVLVVAGFVICLAGLGIFFAGLLREMTRPPGEALEEGGVQMGRFAAAGFGTFFVGFVLAFTGGVVTWASGLRAVARRYR